MRASSSGDVDVSLRQSTRRSGGAAISVFVLDVLDGDV